MNDFDEKAWLKQLEQLRLEALKLALDTVTGGGDDRSGNTTASAVLLIADRYMNYILTGDTTERRIKRVVRV